jgi:hypothetical protein
VLPYGSQDRPNPWEGPALGEERHGLEGRLLGPALGDTELHVVGEGEAEERGAPAGLGGLVEEVEVDVLRIVLMIVLRAASSRRWRWSPCASWRGR